MDINGDNNLDIVSGGFEGFVYYMYSDGKGQYSSPQRLKDSSGADIHLGEFYNNEKKKWDANKDIPVRDLGVYPILEDWDNDGDLDLILGGYRGIIGLRINEGSKSEMKISSKLTIVKVQGSMFKNAGASIQFKDWDGDGKKDLICGLNRKGIVWAKNIGSVEKPAFAEAKYLVKSELDGKAPSSYISAEVADMNGDGKLDLIAGSKNASQQYRVWIYFRK